MAKSLDREAGSNLRRCAADRSPPEQRRWICVSLLY